MTTGRPATPLPTAGRRLWLVLVLLVGLLGMHGLISDHASMAAASEPVAAAGAHAPSDATAGPAPMAGMTRAAAADPVASPHAQPPPRHTGTAMAGLCLAVVTGALLLLAATRRALTPQGRSRDRLLARLLARAPALPAPRPPDLVAGLCVSRT